MRKHTPSKRRGRQEVFSGAVFGSFWNIYKNTKLPCFPFFIRILVLIWVIDSERMELG